MQISLALVYLLVRTTVLVSGSSDGESCSGDTLQVGRKTFYFSEDKMSWENAKSFCEETCGGQLAQLRTEEENTAIKKHIYNQTSNCTQASSGQQWFGLRLQEGTKVFSFADGGEPNFSNWKPGEPSYSFKDSPEHCVQYRCWRREVLWNDVSCSRSHLFICEIEETQSTTTLNPQISELAPQYTSLTTASLTTLSSSTRMSNVSSTTASITTSRELTSSTTTVTTTSNSNGTTDAESKAAGIWPQVASVVLWTVCAGLLY